MDRARGVSRAAIHRACKLSDGEVCGVYHPIHEDPSRWPFLYKVS